MKKKIAKVLATLMVALFFVACANTTENTEAVDMDKVRADIQAKEDAFAAGEKARDVDAVAAYYSDDATSFGRNEQPSVGIAAIKEKISRGFAMDSTGDYNVYKVKDLYTSGNSVTEIGSWTKFNAGGTELDNGHYMAYFEKKDGEYRCVRDMAVSTTPAK